MRRNIVFVMAWDACKKGDQMGENKTEKWLAYGRYGNNGTSLHFRIKLESEPVIGRTPIVIRDQIVSASPCL